MRRPDADLEEKREPRVVSSAGAQKGDRIKPSGRSLTLAAIEKRPCRPLREQSELGDGVDAPGRHLRANVRVLNRHRRRRPWGKLTRSGWTSRSRYFSC